MNTLPGIRYDGRHARGEPVALAQDGDHVVIVAEHEMLRFARSSIAVDDPVPGVARRLRLPDTSEIELDGGAAVDTWWPRAKSIAAFAYAIERRWTATLLLGVLAALAMALVVREVLPRAAAPVARHLSPRVEMAIGSRTLRTLHELAPKRSGLSVDERRRVAVLLSDLMHGEPEGDTYRLEFRRLGVRNAFALPGNTIVVRDELVRAVQSDEELVAVPAHEIAHLRERHATRRAAAVGSGRARVGSRAMPSG